MLGTFISFEGIEGSGKTTQIQLLTDVLTRNGYTTLLTREPGGTVISEKIRSILLDSANSGMSPIAELLLYGASRNQHVREVIQPALEAGKVVLCDRYADATTAYQGAARQIPEKIIEEIHRIATEGIWPGLTILIDLPTKIGLMRANKRNALDPTALGLDRFEREQLSFHERVRLGYLEIAKKEPNRIAVVNGEQSVEELHKEILTAIKARLSSIANER